MFDHTVDGCEILHQLVYGLSPPKKKKKTLFTMFHSYRLRLPTGAGFRNHPQYEAIAWKTASCEPSM